MEHHSSSFPRRLLFYIVTGFTLYWLGNVLVVFPWLISRTVGIVAMFISTVLWAYMSFYCLRHVPRKEWDKDTLSMALIFLITAVVQDYFLYAVYRGIPEELYVLSTFLAYGAVFLLPFIIRYIVLIKYKLKTVLVVSKVKLLVVLVVGLISMFITLWSVRFW